MKLLRFLLVLSILVYLVSCMGPTLQSGGAAHRLSINFTIAKPAASPSAGQVASFARLLIPAAGTLGVTLTSGETNYTASQALTADMTRVQVSFPAIRYGDYQVVATATYPGSGVSFTVSSTITVGAEAASATLNLVPVQSAGVTELPIATLQTGSLAAGHIAVWFVPGDSPSEGVDLQLAADPQVALYVQSSTGANLSGSPSVRAANYADSAATGSWVSLYNASALAQSYSLWRNPSRQAPSTAWTARSTVSSGDLCFTSLGTDDAGNVFAAGWMNGAGSYDFGNGVSAAGSAGAHNGVVVKFDPAGRALWARTNIGTPGFISLDFNGIAVDRAGNCYLAGYFQGTFMSWDGSPFTGTGTTGKCSGILIALDRDGATRWTLATATTTARVTGDAFVSVALSADASMVYVVGYQESTMERNYGGQLLSAPGGSSNPVLIAVSSSGVCQWARTANQNLGWSVLSAVCSDSAGAVYVVGNQSAGNTVIYGTKSISAPAAGGYSGVLVKFDALGTAQWARAAISASGSGSFFRVKADGLGNIYVLGSQLVSGGYAYGGGDAGTSPIGPAANNAVLLKYRDDGTCLWARTSGAGSPSTIAAGLVVNAAGQALMGGYVAGSGSARFGPDQGAALTGLLAAGKTAMVLKFAPDGSCLWAQGATAASGDSSISSLCLKPDGSLVSAAVLVGSSPVAWSGGSVIMTGDVSSTNTAGLLAWHP